MRRTAFDERADQQRAAEFNDKFAPCLFCGCAEEREKLSLFGARCEECYRSYVRGDRKYGPPMTLEQRQSVVARVKALAARGPEPGRGWAYALKAREEAGEPLSIAQKDAWRRALREERESVA